jgi:hypothetical protein
MMLATPRGNPFDLCRIVVPVPHPDDPHALAVRPGRLLGPLSTGIGGQAETGVKPPED